MDRYRHKPRAEPFVTKTGNICPELWQKLEKGTKNLTLYRPDFWRGQNIYEKPDHPKDIKDKDKDNMPKPKTQKKGLRFKK